MRTICWLEKVSSFFGTAEIHLWSTFGLILVNCMLFIVCRRMDVLDLCLKCLQLVLPMYTHTHSDSFMGLRKMYELRLLICVVIFWSKQEGCALDPPKNPSILFLLLIWVRIMGAAVRAEKPRLPSAKPPLPAHPGTLKRSQASWKM